MIIIKPNALWIVLRLCQREACGVGPEVRMGTCPNCSPSVIGSPVDAWTTQVVPCNGVRFSPRALVSYMWVDLCLRASSGNITYADDDGRNNILTDLNPDCRYLTSCEMKQDSCRKDSVLRVGGSSASEHTSSTSRVPPKYCSITDVLSIKDVRWMRMVQKYNKKFQLFGIICVAGCVTCMRITIPIWTHRPLIASGISAKRKHANRVDRPKRQRV